MNSRKYYEDLQDFSVANIGVMKVSWAVGRDIFRLFEQARRAYENTNFYRLEDLRTIVQTRLNNVSEFKTMLEDEKYFYGKCPNIVAYDQLLSLIDDMIMYSDKINVKDRWVELTIIVPEVAIQRWVSFGMTRVDADVAEALSF